MVKGWKLRRNIRELSMSTELRMLSSERGHGISPRESELRRPALSPEEKE